VLSSDNFGCMGRIVLSSPVRIIITKLKLVNVDCGPPQNLHRFDVDLCCCKSTADLPILVRKPNLTCLHFKCLEEVDG